MEETWFKSETRDVRPYFGASDFSVTLNEAEIRLFSGSSYINSDGFVLSEEDVTRLSIAIRPNLPPGLLDKPPVPANDLALVCVVSSGLLKNSVIVESVSLDQEMPDEIEVPDEILTGLGGGVGLSIELYIALTRDIPKQIGMPWAWGHWIARRTFKLLEPRDSGNFNIEHLDDAEWIRKGFPARTLYLVEYIGGINDPPSEDSKIASLFIHSRAYKALISEARAGAAKPPQVFLAAEIACQLLVTSFQDWSSVDAPEPKSPLATVLKQLRKTQEITFADLKRLVAEPGTPRLRAMFHADQNSVQNICAS
jgi:hypothetical protein